ncbi:DUF4238 domain-containing protein [Mesorhizobium sp. B2-6-4]|uniref:DUF4238 domain-containing protein n=1 Tax=Mesorhizobium sp. B2-6-4 TaxID=2589913 RepID=UPI001125E7CE|nr:DUF4238 domain-containing protein [Mesorhizobium sp. B2-6-4]TPJ54855.1 DUF4238 domain-containing protein [Mesorhizobium sp. B2-6-4]
MTDKPRKHHFVPQFWIRRFAGADGRLWAYDHDTGRISERSSKQLMQIFNLYTLQPSGADDTTLETVDLNRIDSEGSSIFDRVLKGDRSQSAKEELASFLATQVLRDPDVVTSYNPRAQDLTLSLLEVFDVPDFDAFRQWWEAKYPGTFVTKDEFEHIRSLGLRGAEDALELIIIALDATEGLPELPFTDAVRSPDGRTIIRDKLLGLDWTLKTDPSDRFILGDAGVLYNRGDVQSLSAPLSRGAALYLTPSDSPKPDILSVSAADHDVTNLNLESAARSRRWIVGEQTELGRLRSQVGSGLLPDGRKT